MCMRVYAISDQSSIKEGNRLTISEKPNLLRLGIINFPLGTARSELVGKKHLSNFIRTVEPLSSEIHVVTGNFQPKSKKNLG